MPDACIIAFGMAGFLSRPSVCGFSFGRNLSRLHYPVEASIRSVLPLCDRFVFAVGRGEDDTRARVEAVAREEPKVDIIDTEWPDVRTNGEVLAIEANKAMVAAEATGCTWGFYIQADEVVHESDHAAIVAGMARWADVTEVKALVFRYLHFVLDYVTVDPWMYHKASRIVRLDGSCHIVGDGCGPALRDYSGPVNGGNGYLDKHHLGGHARWAAGGAWSRRARIFHYGWVRKGGDLTSKLQMVENLWRGGRARPEDAGLHDGSSRWAERYPILKRFGGTHPSVMNAITSTSDRYADLPTRWANPRFYREVMRHGFHG